MFDDVFISQVNINITSFEDQLPSKKKIIRSFDLMGREVRPNFNGLLFQINNKGDVQKKFNLD